MFPRCIRDKGWVDPKTLPKQSPPSSPSLKPWESGAYPKCPTRRFGKTEIQMPVLSCGTMRFQQTMGGKDLVGCPAADNSGTLFEPIQESQDNVEACVRAAMAAGINHFETARA